MTPVYGRVALTRLCFEQRARLLDELAALGVEARQLVVGDDANLATARELGFETLERPNVLGRRVNDGFEWACREGGATHVAFCGSDDWMLARYFATLPPSALVKTAHDTAFVAPTGDRLIVNRGGSPYGRAPWIISRAALPASLRPADDNAMRGVDGSIARGLDLALRRRLGAVTPRERRNATRALWVTDESAGLFRIVDFKAGGEQVTPWERLTQIGRAIVFDTDRPWTTLTAWYPSDLVEQLQRFYAGKEAR